MKRNIITGIIFVLAALLLMFGIAAVRGARAVEDEEPVRLGYLIIRARELSQEPEKPVHDKRTTTKAAERVDIEETHGERTETQQQSEERNLRHLGNYKITGYDPFCAHCCGKDDGITSSGIKAVIGETVAMYGMEFGTRIYIDGLGEFTVHDRGVGPGKVDVACDGHPACYAITGWYDVYVVEEVQE